MTPKQQLLYNSKISVLGLTPPMDEALFCSILRTKGGSGERWATAAVSGYLQSQGHNVLIVTIKSYMASDLRLKRPSWYSDLCDEPNVEMTHLDNQLENLKKLYENQMEPLVLEQRRLLGNLIDVQQVPTTVYKFANTKYNWEGDIEYLRNLVSRSHFTAVILTYGRGSSIDASTMYCALEHTSRVLLTLDSGVPDCIKQRDQLVTSFQNYARADWKLWSLEWTRRSRSRNTHSLELHQHFKVD